MDFLFSSDAPTLKINISNGIGVSVIYFLSGPRSLRWAVVIKRLENNNAAPPRLSALSCSAAARCNLVSARGLHMILTPRSARLVPREHARARAPPTARFKEALSCVGKCGSVSVQTHCVNRRGNCLITSAPFYFLQSAAVFYFYSTVFPNETQFYVMTVTRKRSLWNDWTFINSIKGPCKCFHTLNSRDQLTP